MQMLTAVRMVPTRMELQPGARTDAMPDEKNEPDNAGGASLKTGVRYRPGRKD
jgi:hypothetical protein